MDYIFWLGNGTWKPDSWLYLVHYDSWNSIWKAVLQDGKTLFHAIWCECDRVEYNKALIEMAEEVMGRNMVIKEIIDDKMHYMDLLFLADEQEDMIRQKEFQKE